MLNFGENNQIKREKMKKLSMVITIGFLLAGCSRDMVNAELAKADAKVRENNIDTVISKNNEVANKEITVGSVGGDVAGKVVNGVVRGAEVDGIAGAKTSYAQMTNPTVVGYQTLTSVLDATESKKRAEENVEAMNKFKSHQNNDKDEMIVSMYNSAKGTNFKTKEEVLTHARANK